MRLAKYYALDNQYEKVISVYESLLTIDPKDLQTLLNLGSIWFYAKEYKKLLSILMKQYLLTRATILFITIWAILMQK